MVILNIESFKQDPLFYGAYLAGLLFCIAAYIMDPSPIYGFAAGVVAGRGYASGIHHYYYTLHYEHIPKIRFAQYACFGVFSSTGMALNRLHESGLLIWYVICAIMVSSCFTLMRYLDLEYRLYINETLSNTEQL